MYINKGVHKLIIFFLAYVSFFILSMLQASELKTEDKSQPAKEIESNARIFLNNTDIPMQLEESYDRAVKYFDSRLNNSFKKDVLTKEKEKEKEKLLKLSVDFKNRKNSYVSTKLLEIQKNIVSNFTEAELKYLAANSASPFFKKLNHFMRSPELDEQIASPFGESSKIFSESKSRINSVVAP